MSSCVASCCTCSPRASSASATSASSPIGGALPSYRFASKHSTQFHRRPNQKHPLLRNRALFGAVPSVGDPWWSSNHLPLPNSNSVLHRCWSRLLHESARRQPESLRGSPRSVLVCLVTAPITSSRGFPFDAQPRFLAPPPVPFHPHPPAHTPALSETASAPH